MRHTTHTQKYRYTQTQAHTETDTDIIFTFYTFGSYDIHAKDTNFISIPQTYTCTDT